MNAVQALAVLAVGLMTAGCAAAQPGPAAPQGCAAAALHGPFAAVNQCDALAVLPAAVTAIFDYRPAVQPDPRAAFVAARPVLTPEFAETGREASLVWAPITVEQWQRWREAGATVTSAARITADEHPPDTTAEVNRVIAVSLAPPGQPPAAFAVYATAVRPSEATGWRLAAVQVHS